MEISFDPAKREKTLRERGLDFRDAAEVLSGLRMNRKTTVSTTAKRA